jgi:DHA1 family tetracycline resistance protein-like MFS transporter
VGVGKLVAALGERRTLLVGFIVLAIGLLCASLSRHVAVLAVGGACIAGGNGLITPCLSALVSKEGTADEQGLKLGLSSSAASLARIVGPVVGGILFELRGEGVPLLLGAVAAVLAAVLAVARLRPTGGDGPMPAHP